MRERLLQWFSWPRVFVLFALQLAIQQLLLTAHYPPITLGPELVPLDIRPFYGAPEAYAYFAALGAEGRQLYLQTQRVTDLIFPLFYALAYAGLLIRLGTLLPRALQWLWPGALLPFAIALLDIGENLLVIRLLTGFPEPQLLVAQSAGYLTAGKHLLSGVYALSLLLTAAAILGTAAARFALERMR